MTATQIQPVGKPKMEPYDIHVMPQKFHKYLHLKKGLSTGKLLLIFAVVLLVLAGISIGLYFLINQATPPASGPDLNLNVVTEVNNNTNENPDNLNMEPNLNLQEDLNINLILNDNLNVNFNANVNGNDTANTNSTVNTNTPPLPAINYSNSADADNDQLTDVEEAMYKTEINLPDTDSDGFIDGQEVINGYNPRAAGASLIENSGLAIKYGNPVYNYEILYPADWLVKPTDQSLKTVIFQSATGESVEMSVADNYLELPITQWYLDLAGENNINQAEKKTLKNGLEALISPDRLTYYIVSPLRANIVYVIKYNIGAKIRVNFYTTFLMMVNSFNLVEKAQVPATNNNAEPVSNQP